MDFNYTSTDKKLKPFQPIIDYVDTYYEENSKYPDKLGNIKLKKDLDYKYETTNDGNCYTITVKSKKENLTKQRLKLNIKIQKNQFGLKF